MLKLPTMPMEIFKKVLGNIDEKYPFTLSPKLNHRHSFHLV